jgi:hypothetical protein
VKVLKSAASILLLIGAVCIVGGFLILYILTKARESLFEKCETPVVLTLSFVVTYWSRVAVRLSHQTGSINEFFQTNNCFP